MNRFKKILSMTVAGLFLASSVFGATKLHKDLTGADLHVNKVHASTTHIQGGTDPLTNSTAEGMTGLTTFTQGDLLYYNSGTVLSKLGKDATATRYLSNTGTNNNPAWAQIALGTGVSGTLTIANGGTNASSFAQSNGLLYYDGTRLVADRVALTSGRVPYVTTDGRLTDSANLTYDANLLTITGDATVTDLLSFDEADWTGGNVIYVPATGNIATYITAATEGDTLMLASGSYTISGAELAVNKAIHFQGAGVDKTTLLVTGDIRVAQITASNVTFSDMTLSKTTSTTTGQTIYVNGTAGSPLSNVRFRNCKFTLTDSAVTVDHIIAIDAGIILDNCTIDISSLGAASGSVYGVEIQNNSTADTATYSYIRNCRINVTGNTSATAYAIAAVDNSATNDVIVYVDNTNITIANSGAGGGSALYSSGGANALMYAYNSTLNGKTADVTQATSGVLTLSNCSLVNNTTSGTITYAGTVVSKNLGLGTAAVGTSGTNVAILGTGTAPTTSPADCYQTYSADVGGVAGQAGMHVKSELGGVAAINSALGTLNTYTYQKDDLADDGTVTLPDATSGMVIVTCNAESGLFHVQTDGTVTKIAGSTNTAATDSDGNLCVYDGGTGGIVKNRLAATGEIRIVYYYN